ncbi:NEK protein kinase [Lasiodiplodia theobromae]|uniref:NEK protein kinase n=1 Tax=Lasiodiplodia theobromae TaxID=45133 RepID=UPI0015C358B2|nr:NEK protein kinase [Lasiodiplodia theobromae]KAF4534156.1 NEK protein kinase [Lasiodiplodia theobromae]
MVENLAPTLSFETFEDAIAPLFSKVASQTARNAPLDQIVFDKISSLLLSAGKRAWADRPRTYTVLRLINRIDAMDDFILNDYLDIQLPYTERRLPEILKGASRHTFLEKQAVVLTGANELELERGRHRHLNVDGDTFFTILSHLGAGKYGRVDRVRSKLSLEEYARKRIARSRTFSRDTAGMRIFENELSHLKRLRHHHLVTFIGSYTDPRTYRGSLSAAGGIVLVADLANTSLQQSLSTESTRKTSTLMENDISTPTNMFSVNRGVRQPNSNPDVVSLSDGNDATIASSASVRDSLPLAQPSRATFLSRSYTAAFYRTLERDFQNARELLAAMSNGNWGFQEFCEPLSYTSKNFVDTANSIHWERQYFSIDVLGRRFDTYGFGKWFCQRVAYHLGTGPEFSIAGRIWLNILLLELRIVIQTELLHAAKLMYSSEGLRLENPWLIPESEVSKVMESNSKCRHSWEAFKEELRRCEDWAYYDSDLKAESEDPCAEFSKRALTATCSYVRGVLKDGEFPLLGVELESVEDQYAIAWFPFLANMLRHA